MIKLFLQIVFVAAIGFSAIGQGTSQSVSLGAGYANQVWFNLETSDQVSSPKNNWDISFELSGFGVGMQINPSTGIKLWVVPGADTTQWAAVDTSGMATNWVNLTNSDTSWSWGAPNMSADFADGFDVGWGQYNIITHNIMAKRLFVIKLANGSYKKLIVSSLVGGIYKFRYANLDGSDETIQLLNKSDFAGKNFAYFSIENNSSIDREPVTSDWNLTFTQYTGYIPTPYLLTGVLINKDVEAVKVYPVNDPASFVDFSSQTFGVAMNVIGYDWKSFTGTGYAIADSTVYFVKTQNADIWKLIFTGFEGSSTGNLGFTTEKVYSNQIGETSLNQEVLLYPNPAVGGVVSLYLPSRIESVDIYNPDGRCVSKFRPVDSGVFQLDVNGLSQGVYFVRVLSEGKAHSAKLVIQ